MATRKLTKPQHARADRVFSRALHGARACLGQRLTSCQEVMRGGEPQRAFAVVALEDHELQYTIWMWAERKAERHA